LSWAYAAVGGCRLHPAKRPATFPFGHGRCRLPGLATPSGRDFAPVDPRTGSPLPVTAPAITRRFFDGGRLAASLGGHRRCLGLGCFQLLLDWGCSRDQCC
ncbi:unnamed protein product, partial [Symbiodinium microadriaticum]